MTITKIKMDILFPTGSFANERIGLEADISEGEDTQVKLNHLRDLIIHIHKTSNPHLYTESGLPVTIQNINPDMQVEKRLGLFKEDILSCPDIKTLETYKLLVKGKPELQEAYDQRLSQLKK